MVDTLELLKQSTCALEGLEDILPVVRIQKRQGDVPDEDGTFVDEVGVIGLLIGDHHLLHDLQCLDAAFDFLHLNLYGVEPHPRFVVDERPCLFVVELRLVVLVEDVTLGVKLPHA